MNLTDEAFMEAAIQLAKQARLHAPPNPWVGCVVVKNGEIIGKGYTQPPGKDHAEVQALKQAGNKAMSGTLYVTLEPCSHQGRTPPCVDAIVKAGISRVVIALLDPDEKVRGQGILVLRKKGIQISYGILQAQVEDLLKPYLFQRTFKRPFIIGKAAISVDGRIAAQDGTSQWISTKEALEDAHKIRAQSQAIIVGKDTLLKDHPSLTVRGVKAPLIPPLRVVLDSEGISTPPKPKSSTLLFTTKPSTKEDAWEEVIVVPKALNGRGVSLTAVFQHLFEKGVLQVLVEGGGAVLGSLLRERLLDQLTIYVGPLVLGDLGKPLFSHVPIPTIQEAKHLKLKRCILLGETIRIDYEP